MEEKTVVSIFPVECVGIRPKNKPKTTFVLPAGSPEKITRLPIEMQFQGVYAGEGIGRIDRPVAASELAYDLVREFADGKAWAGMPDKCRPGIWVWEGDPNPTDAQIKASPRYQQAVIEQRRFFEALVNQAREGFRLHGARGVSQLHRMAAEQLGITAETWQENLATGNKKCPFCGAVVDVGAVKCPHCGEIIDVEKYALTKNTQQRQMKEATKAA